MYSIKPLKTASLAVILLLIPAYAYANALTPMMWFTLRHLVFGNFLIGLGEGALIVLLYKTKKFPTLAIMILANYISMFAGRSVIDHLGAFVTRYISDAPLYLAPRAILAMFIMLYLLTILLEWPFCIWILKDKPRRIKTALSASAIVQTASYAVIVPLYLFVSSASLYSDIGFDSSLDFAKNIATVYYISDQDGDIYSVRTNGSDSRKIIESHITRSNARLFIRRSKHSESKDLWVSEHPDYTSETLILSQFTSNNASVENEVDGRPVPGTFQNRNKVIDLRPDKKKKWDVHTSFWAHKGLSAANSETGDTISTGFETPFMSWHARNAIVLPGDQVVYQLGQHQIVLLDLNKRQMGILALGRGPVVVLDDHQN